MNTEAQNHLYQVEEFLKDKSKPDALNTIDYLDESDYTYIKQWLKEKGIRI